jgi:3-deoxy-D-manno-octulosonic-acid transferase
MKRLVFRLYGALMWLAQPFFRRKLARRARLEPGYGQAPDERFGRYRQPRELEPVLVWVHAVSLGETRAASVLLQALRAHDPAIRFLLTHGTATGRAEGAALLRDGDVQVWQPWDSRAAVARFFAHFQPRLGLLIETEIWPNLMAGAQARQVPVVLVNGRLSEKSLRQALAMAPLSKPAFRALTAVLAQTEEDAHRFRTLEVDVSGVFGNLKFDAAPSPGQLAQGRLWRAALGQPLVVLASSREGEEDEFFEQITVVAQQIRTRAAINAVAGKGDGEHPAQEFLLPMPRFLIVPRHPQRFDEVAQLAQAHGLRASRRSRWNGAPSIDPQVLSADVWIGDSLGEMPLYYAMADVALLGGSFAPLGGQNLIEAAACGCPVVMGLHTFNFAEAADLAELCGAAVRAQDMQDGVEQAVALALDAPRRALASVEARAFAARNRGAAARTVDMLKPFLSTSARI